jgi:hypothetical protein
MSEACYYFDHYPLKEHYAACEEYLYRHIDWHAKSQEIDEKGVIFFDISDVIALFPHLKLGKNYELICYLSSEYHGIWGDVAAIKLGADKAPIINPNGDWLSRFILGTDFKVPPTAVRPLEVIHNDGTPEGYFEAILCRLFLDAIPYAHFETAHWDIIMTKRPADFNEAWDCRVNIPDWRPRAITDFNPTRILVFQRNIENGIGASDGRDRVYLNQYKFLKEHSCVSSCAPLLIAEEKHYNGKD